MGEYRPGEDFVVDLFVFADRVSGFFALCLGVCLLVAALFLSVWIAWACAISVHRASGGRAWQGRPPWPWTRKCHAPYFCRVVYEDHEVAFNGSNDRIRYCCPVHWSKKARAKDQAKLAKRRAKRFPRASVVS